MTKRETLGVCDQHLFFFSQNQGKKGKHGNKKNLFDQRRF